MPPDELCCLCDESTGKAGRFEDSLYDVDDGGPYCEGCWENLTPELKEDD